MSRLTTKQRRSRRRRRAFYDRHPVNVIRVYRAAFHALKFLFPFLASR